MPTKQREKNIETGQQATHEPWKHPGQSSQDSSSKAPAKKDRDQDFDQASQTS